MLWGKQLDEMAGSHRRQLKSNSHQLWNMLVHRLSNKVILGESDRSNAK